MNDNNPMVSVCIPSYNHEAFISEAITSVLSQTYNNIELIIIDDCSSDNTEEIVNKYLDIDKRLRFYKNKKNVGMAANWNLCLQNARGKYTKILCADDVLEPDCIEKCVKVFLDNPTVSIVSSARLLIDKDSFPMGVRSFSDKYEIMPGTSVIRKCFFAGNLIGEPTAVLFRKEDCKRLFNNNYKQLTDLEMWFYLLEHGDFGFIPEKLCKFRLHENQTTLKNVLSLNFLYDEILLHDDYINKKYIGKTFLNEEKWKFKLSYNVWYHQNYGLDKKTINKIISEYIPLPIFYCLLLMRNTIQKIIRVFRKIKTILLRNKKKSSNI